jgi:NADPH-ferrihemoprotein reductase
VLFKVLTLLDLCCAHRKEALWPELDQLLRDENDVSTGTTYTAAILEYRVEFVKPEEAAHLERNFSLANGHAVHDAQHPCRYECHYSFKATMPEWLKTVILEFTLLNLSILCISRANVVVQRELHTPASDRSCTHLEFDIAGTGLT